MEQADWIDRLERAANTLIQGAQGEAIDEITYRVAAARFARWQLINDYQEGSRGRLQRLVVRMVSAYVDHEVVQLSKEERYLLHGALALAELRVIDVDQLRRNGHVRLWRAGPSDYAKNISGRVVGCANSIHQHFVRTRFWLQRLLRCLDYQTQPEEFHVIQFAWEGAVMADAEERLDYCQRAILARQSEGMTLQFVEHLEQMLSDPALVVRQRALLDPIGLVWMAQFRRIADPRTSWSARYWANRAIANCAAAHDEVGLCAYRALRALSETGDRERVLFQQLWRRALTRYAVGDDELVDEAELHEAARQRCELGQQIEVALGQQNVAQLRALQGRYRGAALRHLDGVHRLIEVRRRSDRDLEAVINPLQAGGERPPPPIPLGYRCSLTECLMTVPMVGPDGRLVERRALEHHYQTHRTLRWHNGEDLRLEDFRPLRGDMVEEMGRFAELYPDEVFQPPRGDQDETPDRILQPDFALNNSDELDELLAAADRVVARGPATD